MPPFFVEWLRNLPDDQAAAMWEYFDGSFTNCEDVVEIIAVSHPLVHDKLCGPPEEEKK